MSHSELQAVNFPKTYKLNEMIDFLIKHNLKPLKKIDVRQLNYYRVRITNPKKYRNFSTKVLPDGIHLIIGYY